MIREYLAQSSIHGLQYIAENDNHLSEKIFWIATMVGSSYLSIIFMLECWYYYKRKAVGFVIDSNYLYWNTSFPAISVCEQKNYTHIQDYCAKMKTEKYEDICEQIISDIAFFNGICTQCTNNDGSLSFWNTLDFHNVTQNVRMKCHEVFHECKWKGKEFNCCAVFTTLRTELGPCYTFNSYLNKHSGHNLNTISNRDLGLGNLEMKINMNFKMFLHAPEDVPNFMTPENYQTLGNKHELIEHVIKVTDIANDKGVQTVSENQRRCRLKSEAGPESLYPVYSYSACTTDCRARFLKKICNCTLHFLPNHTTQAPCTVKGLTCISENFNKLLNLNVVGDVTYQETNKMDCFCPPSCNEPDYQYISKPIINTAIPQDYALVKIKLSYLPSERFIRQMIGGSLELAVSIGGIAGLFLGASLLSFLEILNFIFLRPIYKCIKNTQ